MITLALTSLLGQVRAHNSIRRWGIAITNQANMGFTFKNPPVNLNGYIKQNKADFFTIKKGKEHYMVQKKQLLQKPEDIKMKRFYLLQWVNKMP